MLETGLILGLLAWVSILLTFKNLPPKIQSWLLQHPLLSDTISSLLTFGIIGGVSHSLVAVLATVVSTILVELTLLAYKKGFLKNVI